MRITIYTCVNKKYEDFIPIFVHSILFHNKNCDIEIGVEDVSSNTNTTKSIKFLKEKYPENKIILTKVNFNNIIPNSVRFINTPEIVNEYVYISDIDIVTLQKDFHLLHLNDMEKSGLNYSNIVRPYTDKTMRRLSGLHFATWNSYYPIPDYSDLIKKGQLNHDEVLLYGLVAKRNKVDETLTYRPVHGIHTSPNRKHDAALGWGLSKWKNEWLLYQESDEFKYLLENCFSKRLLENVDIIDKYYTSNV